MRIKARVEIDKGPDPLGRYSYTLFWTTNYHPGHPDGEYAIRERGQCFFAPLPSKKQLASLEFNANHYPLPLPRGNRRKS